MVDVVINVVWLVVGVLVVYPVARTLVTVMSFEEPTKVDWCFGMLLGCIAGLAWPFVLFFGSFAFAAFMVSRRIWAGTWRLPWRDQKQKADAS